jgi:TRAP-type uncharacterized transport system substrate-binding protein
MKDGLLDVVGTGGSLMEPPSRWVLSPFAIEVVETRKAHFISWEAQVLEKMLKDTGNPYYPVTIPPNTFRNQTAPWTVAVKYMPWSVTPEMPDEVVGEIVNVVHKHYKVLGDYTPAGKFVTPQTMGTMGSNLQFYHPVALKFFKEKGIPTGRIK